MKRKTNRIRTFFDYLAVALMIVLGVIAIYWGFIGLGYLTLKLLILRELVFWVSLKESSCFEIGVFLFCLLFVAFSFGKKFPLKSR